MDVFDLAAKITLDTNDYTKGLSDAEKKTSGFGSRLGSSIKSAAKVGAAAFGAIATASAVATKAIVGQAGDVAAYGDNIDKMSQKIGISATAYQEWDAILQHSGTSMDAMKIGFKTLANQIDAGSESFQKLGISQEELANLSTEEIFAKTIEGLQNMEEGAERTALASELLGRGGIELGALLNTSAEDTEKMRQAVHDLGGVMSDEAVKASAAYQDSLQDLQTAFGGAKRTMMAEFFPAMVSVMDGLSAIISGDESGLEGLNKGITEFVSKMTDNVPKILKAGGDLVRALWKGIQTNLPKIISTGSDIIISLVRGLIGAVPQIIEAGVEVLAGFIGALTGQTPDLIQAGLDAVFAIVDGVLDNVSSLVDAGIQLIIALGQGLIDALPEIAAKIPAVISRIINAIHENMPKIVDAGVQLFTALVENLPAIILAITDALPEIITSAIDTILDNIQLMVDAGVQLFVALVQNLPEIIAGIVKAIPQIIAAILDSLGGLGDAIAGIFSAAWDAVVAVWDTVVDFFQAIWDGIVAIFEGIVDWFSDLFSGAADGIEQAWDGIVSFFSGIWNGIVGVFRTVGGWFYNVFKGAATFISDAWNSVVSFFQGIWDGIVNIFESVGEWFGGIFEGAVELIEQAWDGVVSFFEGIWEGITKPIQDFNDWVGEIMEDSGVKVGTSFETGLGDKVAYVTTGKIAQPLKDVASNAKTWGADMVDNLIAGLNSKEGRMRAAVNGLAGIINGALGHSVPKEGPLKNELQWMPHMMQNFARGIRDNAHLVSDELERAVQFEPIVEASISADGFGGGASPYNQTINIYSPKQLTPYEIARQTRNATRDTILQMRGAR